LGFSCDFPKNGDSGCLLKSGQTIYVAVQHETNYRENPNKNKIFVALQQKLEPKT
jgi:hypothetical protein